MCDVHSGIFFEQSNEVRGRFSKRFAQNFLLWLLRLRLLVKCFFELHLTFNFPLKLRLLSAVRCHLWNIRWHHAVRASSRLSLARDGYNRTNSGVTWNLYILFMCNRNNILAWSHHLWTWCFCWPKMFSSASHSSQELYCFYIHALFPRAYLLLFSITVFFFLPGGHSAKGENCFLAWAC